MTTSEDATLKNFGVSDDGRFKRTAIQTNETGVISFDVTRSDGKHLCRINVCEFAKGGSVDIIVPPELVGTVLSWDHGMQVLRYTTPPSATNTLVAIQLNLKEAQ